MRRSAFVTAGLAASLCGCINTAPEQPFVTLDAASEPLRSRFNAARGKVRVVMLVSPT
jgi:hypothetical protein